MSFYDLSVNNPAGESISMSDFKGKTVMVVNTATKCGLTPQFDGLETLYQKYKDQGFVILGFPCNQFLNQSPESNDEVVEACRINHGVTFPLTEDFSIITFLDTSLVISIVPGFMCLQVVLVQPFSMHSSFDIDLHSVISAQPIFVHSSLLMVAHFSDIEQQDAIATSE